MSEAIGEILINCKRLRNGVYCLDTKGPSICDATAGIGGIVLCSIKSTEAELDQAQANNSLQIRYAMQRAKTMWGTD